MNSILQHDFQRLTNDIEQVRHVLKLLENDRVSWARRDEKKDLSDLTNFFRKIEVDLSISMNDLTAKDNDVYKNKVYIIDKMRHAFSYVNDLFHDIKNIKNDLERYYIQPSKLEILEIDWARFRKNIFEVRNFLQDESS